MKRRKAVCVFGFALWILLLAAGCQTGWRASSGKLLHASRIDFVKTGGMALAGFFEGLHPAERLPGPGEMADSLAGCRKPPLWERWLLSIGVVGRVQAQSGCFATPCSGRYVRLITAYCTGMCFGSYPGGFTNGPENTGVRHTSTPGCWGGNNGIGGGCPCRLAECSNTP